jgi:16S rRNA (cytidine1402-2'-O)-methyltransferase
VIILAASPIGNLGDHSPRLIDALTSAHMIVAEDTRKAKTLLSALGVTPHQPIKAMHEHNERQIVDDIVDLAKTRDVVVLTDAGMPGISDPGYVIVTRAHDVGVKVSVIPGPSAVISALAVSGLPTDRFSFDGFIPKKGRKEFFATLASEKRTMVFFESPHRLADTLQVMAEVLGPSRRATVCRELTKMFEEVRRGTLTELIEWCEGGVKGEITLVVEGQKGTAVSLDDALEQVAALVAGGKKTTEAAKQVASETGLSKRELYEAWSRREA